MRNRLFNFFGGEDGESYPDFFLKWDNAVNEGEKPGFYETEELIDIIEIYIIREKFKRAKHAINYALRFYSDNDDLISEIFLLLNDYGRWNDILTICEQIKDELDAWINSHRLTALLHLGMEEEAFLLFRKLLKEYAGDEEDLSTVYQAMGEALCDVDLFDSSIEVAQEALKVLGEDASFYWIQMRCYIALDNKKEIYELLEVVQKLNPLDPDIWMHVGVTFTEIGEVEKAVEAFEYAQSLGRDTEEVLKHIIRVYENGGDLKKALEKCKELLVLCPSDFVTNMMVVGINFQLENWSEAIEYLDKTLKITPAMEALYLQKSDFLLRMEEYEKAKSVLKEGLINTEDRGGSISKELSELDKKYPNY